MEVVSRRRRSSPGCADPVTPGDRVSPAVGLWLGIALLAAPVAAAVNPLAPASLDDCDRLVAEQPATLLSYQCYYHAARVLGQGDAVRRRLEAILAREPANPWARFALGGVEFLRGSPTATTHYREAADGLARFGDARGEVWVRLLLSQALANHGDIAGAGEEVRHAARVAAAAGGDRLPWAVWVRVNEAWQALREADYLRAETILLRCEPAVFPSGNPYLQSSWLDVRATFAAATDRAREAATLFQRQAEAMRGVDDRYEESAALFDQGLVTLRLVELGEVEREAAAGLFERAARVGVEGRNHGARSGALIELGRLAREPRERRRRYEEGIGVARAAQTPASLRRGLALLGASFVGEAPVDLEQGLKHLAEAEALARTSADLEGVADTRLERAAALWDRARQGAPENEVGKAVEASIAALGSVEGLRARQRGEIVRAGTLGHWSQAYSRLAGQLLARPAKLPDDVEATALAFAVMERRRARELLERVRSREPEGGSGPGRSPERETLLARIAAVQRRLQADSLSRTERSALVAQLPRLEIEETVLRATGEPDAAGTGLQAGWTTALREVQEALRPDEALLAFQVANAEDVGGEFDGGSWLIVVTRDAARAYPLPEARGLERSTRLLLGLLQRREGSEKQAAARLHRDLLEGALAELPEGVHSLIMVPDGPLHGMPFGALGPGRDGALLGDRFRLATFPSAALWLRWRAAPQPQVERAALVFADPASVGRAHADDGREATLRSWALETGERLGPLPMARREASNIRRRLPPGAVVLVAGAASERTFKQIDLSRFGLLHVAAHGVIDDANPDRTGLLLAADGEEDGILQVRELSDLRLDGQVVVLSSCRSAAGALLGGEGPMGLARAFLASGAGAVVASLWPVRDEDAFTFFGEFYGGLSEGESVSIALARAQRGRRAAGAPADAWAGFVVYGDGDAVPVARGRTASPWPALGAAGLLSAAVAAGLSRRRSDSEPRSLR